MNYENKLKEIREEQNLSQEEVATILNIKRSTYGHYETEYQTIPINHLINFCEHFNISIDYIFNFSKKKTLNYKKTEKKTIGNRLKEIRKENKLTQEKLAKILNTTKSVISGYEHGRYLIATPFLYTICKKYNISADYLLGKTDEPKYLKTNQNENG